MTTEHAPTTDTIAELGRLINEFFRAVSFDSGEKPSYYKLGDLFIEGGKLIKNSSEPPEISTVDEFIAPRIQMVDSGTMTSFREVESTEITEIFGGVAHRFSTYEKHGVINGTPFAGRGAISTQFIRTPSGWKMTSMAWDDERPGLTLPHRYQ
jgi:hypothetical protein